MTNRYEMYNNDDGDENTPPEKRSKDKIEVSNDSIIIESNGKKISVVTKEQYDRQTVELEKIKKQFRILTTEVQQLRRFVNKISKSMVEGYRERFD